MGRVYDGAEGGQSNNEPDGRSQGIRGLGFCIEKGTAFIMTSNPDQPRFTSE